MKTVRKICPPKIGGHYKTQAQFDADKKKADERIERLGIKNNRVSGN